VKAWCLPHTGYCFLKLIFSCVSENSRPPTLFLQGIALHPPADTGFLYFCNKIVDFQLFLCIMYLNKNGYEEMSR